MYVIKLRNDPVIVFPPARPQWIKPEGTELPKLKLYNSLTRQKVYMSSLEHMYCYYVVT